LVRSGPSRKLILAALGDNRPKSCREIVRDTRLSSSAVYNALYLCWRQGLVLRTKKPLYERDRVFKGRDGLSQTTRSFHLYVFRPEGVDSLSINARAFRTLLSLILPLWRACLLPLVLLRRSHRRFLGSWRLLRLPTLRPAA